jgi:hypothetical protein
MVAVAEFVTYKYVTAEIAGDIYIDGLPTVI